MMRTKDVPIMHPECLARSTISAITGGYASWVLSICVVPSVFGSTTTNLLITIRPQLVDAGRQNPSLFQYIDATGHHQCDNIGVRIFYIWIRMLIARTGHRKARILSVRWTPCGTAPKVNSTVKCDDARCHFFVRSYENEIRTVC